MMEDEVSDMNSALRSSLEARIIALLLQEIQDKNAILTRETRREEVSIDSIDIVHVIFAIEEEFNARVELSPNLKFETVGDLLDALMSFIPESSATQR